MTTRACLILKQHQTHTPTRSTPYALLALHPALTENQSWEKRLFKEGISLVDNFDTPFVFAAAVFEEPVSEHSSFTTMLLLSQSAYWGSWCYQ